MDTLIKLVSVSLFYKSLQGQKCP